MRTEIRRASGDDAQRVASFFTDLYETRHGIGSAGSLEMLQRTIASLVADDGELTVFISEGSGDVQGVAAVRHGHAEGACEMVTIQADDTIRGRGVAQTLLTYLVKSCASCGSATLATSVPASDVRARGFLRREGFVASAEELATASPTNDGSITYMLDVAAAVARVTLSDDDLNPQVNPYADAPGI